MDEENLGQYFLKTLTIKALIGGKEKEIADLNKQIASNKLEIIRLEKLKSDTASIEESTNTEAKKLAKMKTDFINMVFELKSNGVSIDAFLEAKSQSVKI